MMSGMNRPEPARANAQLQKLGAVAVEELRTLVRKSLAELVGGFLAQLPAVLTEQAPKLPGLQDRARLVDVARAIPHKAALWADAFAARVDAQLIGGVIEADEDSGSSGGDEPVALAALELKAESRYAKLVTELDARLNRIRLMVYVAVHTRALAPASLYRTLYEIADTMPWPVKQRALLAERFDAIVVPQLDGFYHRLIDALARIGNQAVQAAAPLPPPKPAAVIAEVAKAMQPPADTSKLDDETASMLQAVARKADGAGYHDGLLAADLLALNEGKPLPGLEKDRVGVPIQRIGLAGHFLNVAIADALVPQEARPEHESVRFPLMKSALTDPSLFTSATHPLGSLIHEMLLKSATSRITGNREAKRMAELLEAVLVQFDLAPEFVRQAMQGSAPVQKTQIDRFFEFQRQQAQQRRDFVIGEAKRVVARHLEQASFGRDIPAPALRFINVAWGPLLTRRLLRHGAEHAAYQTALQQMDQLLDLIEARGTQPPGPAWKTLLEQLARGLVAEGVPAEKARQQAQALHAAYALPLAQAM